MGRQGAQPNGSGGGEGQARQKKQACARHYLCVTDSILLVALQPWIPERLVGLPRCEEEGLWSPSWKDWLREGRGDL
eukprot:12688436-Alexandrium_andersonii.AAC.1